MGMITKGTADPVCVLYDLGMSRLYTDGGGHVSSNKLLFSIFFILS